MPMIPEVIRERLETLDLQTYKEAKEYAIKQARKLKKTSSTSTLDLNETRRGWRRRIGCAATDSDGDDGARQRAQRGGTLEASDRA